MSSSTRRSSRSASSASPSASAGKTSSPAATAASAAARIRRLRGRSSKRYRTVPRSRLGRCASKSGSLPELAARQDAVQVVEVVDHAPLRSAGLLHPRLPFVEAPEVAARIDVVGLELDDVDRDHPDVLQADREAAHRDLVELLLHVG